jgi:hypothetical protein
MVGLERGSIRGLELRAPSRSSDVEATPVDSRSYESQPMWMWSAWNVFVNTPG